ncbi:hypothetical protein SAMN04487944_12925 [Gracilibacillus ureilyticus]|uniref:Uncharacterized protein n=1 Tax=Gracilibacillus ureilyticus TaxID=531814 RepID=A0A1H9VXD7_9BACI|nr:hypothetical protein SAMN04487944_12925 [Gracilibacillus ureilyticus]
MKKNKIRNAANTRFSFKSLQLKIVIPFVLLIIVAGSIIGFIS